jgi:hypothetical protein
VELYAHSPHTLFNDGVSSSDCIASMVGLLDGNELERMWKETVLA